MPAGWAPATALVLGLAVGVAACTNGAQSAAPSTTETTAPTETTLPTTTAEPPGEQIWVFDLVVGECFDERVVPDVDPEDVHQLFRVDCSLPHVNEVYLVTTFPAEPGAPYPGEAAITEFADPACLAGFQPFVGIQYELSRLQFGRIVPTEESWTIEGDRELTCFVFDIEGEKLVGHVEGTRL